MLTQESQSVEGVKSADRAMAILDVFRLERCPLSARALADSLAMPRSSTNVLLRSMIAGGYLRYDEQTATYYPTLKVFHLGSWLIEDFLSDPAIEDRMRQISSATAETVCLWARVGLSLVAVHFIDCPQPITLQIKTGTTAPLFGSVVGSAMLELLDDQKIEQLADRYDQNALEKLDREALWRDIAATRKSGFSLGYNRWLPDAGAIAVAISPPQTDEPLVIGVGGPVFRIKRNESDIQASLRDLTSDLK